MNLMARSTPLASTKEQRIRLEEQLRQAAAQPESAPLSFAQQRLWVLDQLEPDRSLYNVPVAIELLGALDLEALQRALNSLIARHEILRTRFACPEEAPVQLVEENAEAPIALQDLTAFEPAERHAESRRILQAEVNRPFELGKAPLIRLTLLRLDADTHWLILNLHHIVSDEWSLRICLRELTTLYGAYRDGNEITLPELPIQYADYAVWQRDWLRGEVLETQLAYWRKQLAGAPPVLELLPDFPRPAAPTCRAGSAWRALPAGLVGGLKDLAGSSGASLFMVLLAAFKTLLHRHTHQTDILVGSPVAGRNRIETEGLIGFFVNTLVLRTDLSGNPTFEELLARVRETTLGACANQDLPFEKVVEELHPERASHMPFTRIVFALQNPGLENLQWPGLAARWLDAELDGSKFDLTFLVRESNAGLVAFAEFDRDLFQPDSIARLLEHFEILLSGIAASPGRRLSALPLLSEFELRQVRIDWNNTRTDYPRNQSIPGLFEAQAQRAPGALAVRYGRDTLTFEELNCRANQLARLLRSLTVGSGVPVGLCLERSTDLILAMLAIVKSGGAYVPLDPSYPKERLGKMLTDSKAPVLITKRNLLNYLPQTSAQLICLDEVSAQLAQHSRENLPPVATAEHIAYIMYTSGSSGEPKGVAVPHRAIVRLVLETNYIRITAEDRIAQASNTSFDAATFEIWGALLNGARLVGVATDVALSPQDFARALREEEISILFLTTSLFKPDCRGTARRLCHCAGRADRRGGGRCPGLPRCPEASAPAVASCLWPDREHHLLDMA